MSVRRPAAVLFAPLCVAGIGCSSPASPPPAPRLALLAMAATSTEDGSDPQIFRLDVTLGNPGLVAAPLAALQVVDAGLYKDPRLRIALPEFQPAPGADLSPLAKDESRTLTFLASERSQHRCSQTCDQNPHYDLLQLQATLVNDGHEWFFLTDVAITCGNELPRLCKVELAEGCQATDVTGGPLRCLPTWTEVLADNLCGTVESDLITRCVGGKTFRTIRVAGVDYQYNYPQGTLTGVTSSKDGCLAGPCEGSPPPPPGDCEAAKAFYECGGGGDGGAGI